MPNQLNYPNKLTTTANQRPNRLADIDLKLLRTSEKQILFGTTVNDTVELWVYNPDGTFAGHMNLGATDAALTATTIVDTDGAHELLNLDLNALATRMTLPPGRYAMVANFFRNEVGAEQGYKLYISDISDDRTELRLQPVALTPEVIKDVYEFVTPSVPREFAQALIAEILGQSLSTATETTDAQYNQLANPDKVETALNTINSDTSARLQYSETHTVYVNLVYTILIRAYAKALDLMAADVTNLYVQHMEIMNYIMTAVDFVVTDMTQKGEVDPHFILS